jgi:hypothetical protein
MSSNALAVLFLPGFVGELFRDNGRAHLHNFMDELSVQALAMCR